MEQFIYNCTYCGVAPRCSFFNGIQKMMFKKNVKAVFPHLVKVDDTQKKMSLVLVCLGTYCASFQHRQMQINCLINCCI